ncbi:hypothetical protein [Streptomyces antibioticus]|uniref:hypothetical protein n=1 Tax=Streptomyces antibioticus TaxID=1890 RepID=UPI003D70FC19
MSRAQEAADLGALLSSSTTARGKTAALPAVPAPSAEPVAPADRLRQLEQVVETSGLTFRRAQARHYREVGPALEEIRDQELYAEAGYASWHDYLRRRWEYSEAHAYRFIELGKVAAALAPLGDKALSALTAESQARELAPVLRRPDGEDAARRVWVKVTADPDQKVTARRVAKVRDSLLGVSPIGETTPAAASPAGTAEGAGDVLDAEVVDDRDDQGEALNYDLRTTAEALEQAQRRMTDAAEAVKDGAVPVDLGAAVNDLNRIRRAAGQLSRTELSW